MPALAAPPPTKQRILIASDTPSSLGQRAADTARHLDPDLPGSTAGVVGQIARVLVDNAQQHGRAPISIELSVTAVVSIEVTDHGAGVPAALSDGTGSLAVIVGSLATFWDVIQHTDSSKTVTALVSVPEEPAPHTGKRVRR